MKPGPSSYVFIILEFDHIYRLIIHYAGICHKLVKMSKFLNCKTRISAHGKIKYMYFSCFYC